MLKYIIISNKQKVEDEKVFTQILKETETLNQAYAFLLQQPMGIVESNICKIVNLNDLKIIEKETQ